MHSALSVPVLAQNGRKKSIQGWEPGSMQLSALLCAESRFLLRGLRKSADGVCLLFWEELIGVAKRESKSTCDCSELNDGDVEATSGLLLRRRMLFRHQLRAAGSMWICSDQETHPW